MNELSYLSVLEFTGKDATKFLHNQLSADINGLAQGESTFACLCQPKGRVIVQFLVHATDQGLMALCAADLAGAVAGLLQKYVFRDDVKIAIRDDLAVFGPAPDSGVEHHLSPLPGLDYGLGERSEGSTDPGAWKAHELAAGITWLSAATTEKYLPQMLGAEAIGALNFRKGCYPGQEIIARTHYLGKLKQQALLLVTREILDMDVGEDLIVRGDSEEARAELVDQAGLQLFLVVRSQPTFAVRRIEWREQSAEVSGHWPSADASTRE